MQPPSKCHYCGSLSDSIRCAACGASDKALPPNLPNSDNSAPNPNEARPVGTGMMQVFAGGGMITLAMMTKLILSQPLPPGMEMPELLTGNLLHFSLIALGIAISAMGFWRLYHADE